MPTAFVLGLFDTGLAVVRGLGRMGVRVRGFDYRTENYGFRSRYGQHVQCPNPSAHPEQLVAFLLEAARASGDRVFLFPTSDAFLEVVSDYRESLHSACEFVLPPKNLVDDVLDKGRQYSRAREIGIPVPETHEPANMDEVRELAPRLSYPVLLKPQVGHVWRESFRKSKGIRVGSAHDLVSSFEEIFAAGHKAMAQGLIVGPNTNHFKVSAYMGEDNEPVATICMRKIRQLPVDFGVGTMLESVHYPELEELGLRFLRGLRWRGTGSVEFKRDERDGQLWLIELNPRLWQQNGLAATCGLNFPWIQYEDMCGRRPLIPAYRAGVRWLDEFRDWRSALVHRRMGELTLGGYLASLRGVRCAALWAVDDMGPFWTAFGQSVANVARKAVGRGGIGTTA